jgi:CheY-like chemotaxis protein
MKTPPSDAEIQLRFKELHILVVDDSSFDRELAVATLRKLGIHNVQIAENGSVGIGKIRNAKAVHKPFDVILLDSKMPTLDGLSLVKWLRSESKLRNQAIIVTTGTVEAAEVKQFIEVGANLFIVKPVSLPMLKTKILEAIGLEKKNAS